MRACSRVFEKQQLMPIRIEATNEEMSYIAENKAARLITVTVVFKDSNGNIVAQEQHEITNDFYDLLMSEYPEYAPNKPANEYREADLWHVIDLLTGVK
jgi:hypothetical protein